MRVRDVVTEIEKGNIAEMERYDVSMFALSFEDHRIGLMRKSVGDINR